MKKVIIIASAIVVLITTALIIYFNPATQRKIAIYYITKSPWVMSTKSLGDTIIEFGKDSIITMTFGEDGFVTLIEGNSPYSFSWKFVDNRIVLTRGFKETEYLYTLKSDYLSLGEFDYSNGNVLLFRFSHDNPLREKTIKSRR